MALHTSLAVYQKIPGIHPFPLLDLVASEMRVTVGKRTEEMESTEYEAAIYDKHGVERRTNVGNEAKNSKG